MNDTNQTLKAPNNLRKENLRGTKRDSTLANNTDNKMMSNTISNFGFGGNNTTGVQITEEENFIEPDFFDVPKDQIKLNTKYGTSLRMHLEKLDLIPEFEENEKDRKKLNNENLFKKKNPYKSKLNINEANDLNEMNKFNNEIITDSKWGSTAKRKEGEDHFNTKQFTKPNKKNVEKELGKNIVNTKIPRARLLTKVKDPSFAKIANKTGGAFGNSNFFNDTFNVNSNNTFNKTGLNFNK